MFRAVGDDRADALLVKAHDAMMTIADALPQDDRRAFLDNLGLHRAIASAWASRAQSG